MNQTLDISTLSKTGTLHRHSNSKFRQQALAAWQPILKGNTVLPVFFIIGAIFIPLGILLVIISSKVKEFIYDYTYCINNATNNSTCADFISNPDNAGQTCYCNFDIELLSSFDEPVFIYYGLKNFYQNHRRYVRSRDDDQLYGVDISPSGLKAECDPFKTVTDNKSEVFGIAPCGVIANTLFNDSFSLIYNSIFPVSLIKTGIALITDKESKFHNPKSWANYKKPPNWNKPVWMLDPLDPGNNGYQNEDLIVWMRTAAIPDFRKLYRYVNTKKLPFNNNLPAGNYTITVDYNYPVASFHGRKEIVISTTSILGGKNPFLGYAYIVVGSINIVCGVAFIISNHIKKDKQQQSDNVKVKIVKFY